MPGMLDSKRRRGRWRRAASERSVLFTSLIRCILLLRCISHYLYRFRYACRHSITDAQLEAIVEIFALVRIIAVWRENKKELRIIDAAVEDIKRHAKWWKKSLDKIIKEMPKEDELDDDGEDEETIVYAPP